jgi:hypothetical protein
LDEINTNLDPTRDLQNHRNPIQCNSSNAARLSPLVATQRTKPGGGRNARPLIAR